MAYDKNDFVIRSSLVKEACKYAQIIAENHSSIPIKGVWVDYNRLDKSDVIQGKYTEHTGSITKGEKVKILYANTSLWGYKIQVTDITVEADDGTVFKVPPPTVTFSSSSCFVVTAACGNEYHPTVTSFRSLRDEVLVNYSIGQKFIDWYYRNGPGLAEKIEPHPLACAIARAILTPFALVINALRTITIRLATHNGKTR